MSVDTSQRGCSPGSLAWKRLLQNRMAVAGGAVVILIALLCVFGPMVLSGDAQTTRLWLGAQPPGITHPAVNAELSIREGKPLEGITSEYHTLTGNLEVVVRKLKTEEFRIVLRRGVVHSIQFFSGSRKVDSIVLDSNTMTSSDPTRALPEAVVKVGSTPPTGLFLQGERVRILERLQRAPEERIMVTLEEGRVVSFKEETSQGEQAQYVDDAFLRFRGQHISSLRFNGRELTTTHLLGTDELGRDVLLRVLLGGRVSLLVGVVATLVSLFIGVCYGAIAAFRGGLIDRIMMGAVDILYALPFIFLVLLLMVIFDRNIFLLFLALGMVQWLTMARIVRGQVLTLVQMEYIQAARICGANTFVLLRRHLIPHCLGPIIVYTTLMIPTVILEESFLAFIGLPVQYQGTTLDSWGALVHQGTQSLGESGEKSWLLIAPSLAMVLTLFGLNALGDGLRDAFDPKGRA